MESNTAIQELEKAKAELLEKISQIDKTVAMLKSMAGLINGNNHSSKSDDYNKKDTLKKKVAFIIKREGRFLHIRELAEYLNKLESNISIDGFLEKLTGAITSLRIDGVIVKIKLSTSHQHTFWGSPNWLDVNGKPKHGHEPNEGVIKKTETIVI